MDIVTQGALGALLAQAAAPPRDARLAALIGGAAGMLADADTLLGSRDDALLVLEYHRHFSHALAFVPIGALLAALLLWPLLRRRVGFARCYAYALLGYATSGLLDACTSYGTHLLWPFAPDRIAWGIIAVVDPLFTMILLVALALGVRRRRAQPARVGLALAGAYLVLGVVQQQRATAVAQAAIATRGHAAERLVVKPTIGNLLLWRSVYVVDGRVYADGIRVGGPGGTRTYAGESAPLFDAGRELAWAPPDSRARRDVERFTVLSDGMVARDPRDPTVLGDVRYAMLPTAVAPLWGIALDPAAADAPARLVTNRSLTAEARQRFVAMLRGDVAPRTDDHGR